ncbi:MAG TPA: GAF domain-containing protein [Dissulfurispiraceae bacterium]|nr:GAF domain-containing protein [Dissulfurispiraceae bacterium]
MKSRFDSPNDDIVDSLAGIAAFIERQEQLDESFHELVALAAAALKTGHCSLMLLKQHGDAKQFRLKVFSHSGHLHEQAVTQEAGLDECIAGQVVTTGRAIRVDDISTSPYARKARRPQSGSTCFLSAPIPMYDKIAGVINFSEPLDRNVFTEHDLLLARLSGLLIGKSLQAAQLQNLMKSRYLHFAISQESAPFIDGTLSLDGRNAQEMAKILSRTFYREMTKAGFGAEDILGAATEIISLLSQRVARLKSKQSPDETK